MNSVVSVRLRIDNKITMPSDSHAMCVLIVFGSEEICNIIVCVRIEI